MSYPAAMQALLDQFGNQDAIAQKIVQVGSFQPFDLVRVHSNPANLVLTNAHEGSVATSTVVLLTDGQARAGLKFKPDTSVIRDRHDQQLHLIIASGIDQVVTVEFEDYPAKELQVTANQPALFSIGMLFGIPVIASTASFFDVATGEDGGNDDTSGALLINCLNQAGKLTYTGGTADFGSIFGEKTAFLFSKPITAGYAFQYENPEPVSGVRAINDLRIKISSSPDPAYSFFNNDDIFIQLTNPGIGGSDNRFFDVYVKESVGGQSINEWWYFNEERLRIHVTVNLDSLDIVVTDLVTQETQTHTTNLSGLMAQPMYLHIGAILSEQASTLDHTLIQLPFSELDVG